MFFVVFLRSAIHPLLVLLAPVVISVKFLLVILMHNEEVSYEK